METEPEAKAQALPPKAFPIPSLIPEPPGDAGRMRVQPEELVPCFGGRHSVFYTPGKAKERAESCAQLSTGSLRTQPEQLLNLLIKLCFSVGDQGFTVY